MPALVYILLSIALAVLIPWRPEPGGSYRAGAEPLRCQPPSRLKRTYVGFADGEPGLSDFEPAAGEATRILKAVQQQSCALGEQEDAGGRLHTALSTRPLEIARVLFTRVDLSAADIYLRAPSGRDIAASPPGAPTWTIRLVCNEENTWQVVSSSRH